MRLRQATGQHCQGGQPSRKIAPPYSFQGRELIPSPFGTIPLRALTYLRGPAN